MKNFLSDYLEKIVAGICLLGLCLRLGHISGGATLLVFFMAGLALLYFPFGFFFLRGKTTGEGSTAIAVISGLVLFLSPLGILYKAMHWPGAHIMLILGLGTALPMLGILAISHYNTNPELKDFYRGLLIRTGIWVLLMVVSYNVTFPKNRFTHEEGERRRNRYLRNPSDIEEKRMYQEYLYSVDSIDQLHEIKQTQTP